MVSAALTPHGNCDRILRASIENHIRLAWSTPMLNEYREILSRPKFKLSESVVNSLLTTLGPTDQVFPPVKSPKLPDSDDEVFLATALSTSDKILVTGNTAHYPTDICAPVRAMTPAEAIQRLLA